MKKILWLTNVMLPIISVDKNAPINNYGGWLTGFLNAIKEIDEISLFILCPTDNKNFEGYGKVDNIEYFCFYEDHKDIIKYSKSLEDKFVEILKKVNPSITHIFGTEYAHTLSMVRAFNNPKKTVINIQGMVSVYAQHYYANIPYDVIYRFGLFEVVKMKNIALQRKEFIQRGLNEITSIKNVNHVIGRTDWDKACTTQINESIQYHFCNETLRDEFYNNRWEYSKCEKYSIFISQANYPIKGFHMFLSALSILVKKYPQIKVYVAGDRRNKEDLFSKIKMSSYDRYIQKMIKSNALENHIVYTGGLNAKEMCDMYLKTHVFVSPSSIENSPNSIGEAMILGVPVVSSDVGGIRSQLTHAEEGFLYPFDEPYMLAYYIEKIFKNDNIAKEISDNARRRANETYNKHININRLVEIYDKIIGDN